MLDMVVDMAHGHFCMVFNRASIHNESKTIEHQIFELGTWHDFTFIFPMRK